MLVWAELWMFEAMPGSSRHLSSLCTSCYVWLQAVLLVVSSGYW